MRYRFGDCVLDTDHHILEVQGQSVRLQPRVFKMLNYLLEQRRRVVPHQELFEQVWSGQHVSKSALDGCIKQVRQAIGDSGRAQRLLKTQHGVGYRFVAPVTVETLAETPQQMADPYLQMPAFSRLPTPSPSGPERRQLTILSCALADESRLLSQFDPDELHAVVRTFHALSTDIMHQYGGAIAQRFDDGCLVYFGYPQAHDDDARRAVVAGLRLVEAVPESGGALKLGIHTGEVVVESFDDKTSTSALVVGGVSSVASALRDLAAPQTVLISVATARLVEGYVTCRALPPQTLQGHSDVITVYQVTGESRAQFRLDIVPAQNLTPFVGREAEQALLDARWTQACEGRGQAVVISGEAGIGKSRLVRLLSERLLGTSGMVCEARGSPYHQQTALHPVSEMLCLTLRLDAHPGGADAVQRCEAVFRQYGLDAQTHLPFLAPILNLSLPSERYAAPQATPRQIRQRTFESLIAFLLALAGKQPLLFVIEDLHWMDPSTLEWLDLLLDQMPSAAILLLLTCRPEFEPPWPLRSYMTQLALDRLTSSQSTRMVESIAQDAPLSIPVVHQIVEYSGGVPLFVEELTQTVLDTGLVTTIPVTLQDTLMARLDQVGEAKRTAQLGAVIGRQFDDVLMRAVSPLDEVSLQQDLRCLLDSELLYQRGVGHDVSYLFKHALIQDTAYASLLRRTRQQLHRQIAEVLEAQFPETKATQPELLAYHYTEAGLGEQAIPYWQQAGQLAYGRSAYAEAITHLTKGLDLLLTLPEGPERTQQELELQMTLGTPLMASKGWAAPEVQHTYARALELCQQTNESPYLFPALYGLCVFYFIGGAYQTAFEVGERCLRVARQAQDPGFLLESHSMVGSVLLSQGEFVRARAHLEQGITLYDPQHHQSHAAQYGQDPGMVCHSVVAMTLWLLGYPDQALAHIQTAYTLSQNLTHSMNRMFAMEYAGWLHLFRREGQAARQWAEPLMSLAYEQDASHILAVATLQHGWARTIQGESEGLTELRQGLADYRKTGAGAGVTVFLAALAEVTGQMGRYEEGLALLREALVLMEQNGEHMWEAELYRGRGEILLRQGATRDTRDISHILSDTETYFNQALSIARRQQAKSLELRAATSLARLRQSQGKRQAAYDLLMPVYGWFTEGFDTADLQDAKALLNELG